MKKNKQRSYIAKEGEKKGYDGISYERGFIDALQVEDSIMFDSKVHIKPFDVQGTLIGIYMSRTSGIKYQVRYFMDGKILDDYFYEWEISHKPGV